MEEPVGLPLSSSTVLDVVQVNLVVGGDAPATPDVEEDLSLPLVVGEKPKVVPLHSLPKPLSVAKSKVVLLELLPSPAAQLKRYFSRTNLFAEVVEEDEIVTPSTINVDSSPTIAANDSVNLVVGGDAPATPDVEEDRCLPLVVGEKPKVVPLHSRSKPLSVAKSKVVHFELPTRQPTVVKSTTTRRKAMRSREDAALCVGNRVQVAGLYWNRPGCVFKGTISAVHVGRRSGIAFDDATHEVFDNQYITLIPSED